MKRRMEMSIKCEDLDTGEISKGTEKFIWYSDTYDAVKWITDAIKALEELQEFRTK